VGRELDLDLRTRIEGIMGRRVISARFVDRGYTPAERWVVTFEDGSSAFAKSGVDSETSKPATWLRNEHRAYSQIVGDFMPRMLSWDDDGTRPLLLLEDLSNAVWPPPWNPAHIEAVRRTLDAIAATPPPERADDLDAVQRSHLEGWKRLGADPAPFLALGLASETWLALSLPSLIEASDRAVLSGNALVHFDVRSDNICIAGAVAKLIDWPGYARGNSLVDLVAWLPSLHREGGPAPWELVTDSEGLAPLLAGYFAAQSGLPAPPTAPRVRVVQYDQLLAALPWAIRELGLAPLDGPNAPPAE
jgi:hypothetical protein